MMDPDEQETKSVRYVRGALVIPLKSGNFGLCTKWNEFIGTCTLADLPAMIQHVSEMSHKTHQEAVRPIVKVVKEVVAKPPPKPVGNPDDLGL